MEVPRILPDTRGVAYLLYRHYGPGPRQQIVFYLKDGTITPTYNPSTGTYSGGQPATNDPDPYTDIISRVYSGGSYSVSAAEVAALTAAGYSAFIS